MMRANGATRAKVTVFLMQGSTSTAPLVGLVHSGGTVLLPTLSQSDAEHREGAAEQNQCARFRIRDAVDRQIGISLRGLDPPFLDASTRNVAGIRGCRRTKL